MNDLISRQAAINAVENTDCELSSDAWEEITDAIMQAPSAQPERMRGQWLLRGKCSLCGGNAPFWPMATTYYKSNYCPQCGAKMDLGVKDE